MRKAIRSIILILALSAPVLAAGVEIKTVQDPGELPVQLREFVRKGDILVTDGKYLAVIAGSDRTMYSTINYDHPEINGFVLAFAPQGASKRLATQFGAPAARIAGKALIASTRSAERSGTGVVALATCEGPGGVRLEIRTRYDFAFDDGRMAITAEVRNAGKAAVEGLSFGLGANAAQNFNFSPFHAAAFPRLNFRVYERPDYVLAWFNPNLLETSEKPLPGTLRPGQVHKVTYSLLTGTDLADVLRRLYRLAGAEAETVSLDLGEFDGPAEVLVRDPATGALFFRTFLDKPSALSFPLPKGIYRAQAHFFPAIVEKTFAVDGRAVSRDWKLSPPAFGTLRVGIKDKRMGHVPGKVSFLGLAPTPSPYFRPDNPVETGRSWETFKNSVFPTADGLEVRLPAGAYLAVCSRGPEYTRETRIVEVLGGPNPGLDFTIDKAVDTRGLVSLDSHMHTRNSDGAMGIPERLRSVVAEGIEVAVAADHNFVTDYGPDLRALGLSDHLAVISGNEVTARTGSIHYNTFPDAVRPGEPGRGAISVRDETPGTLFELSREKNPGTLIHVNHPRWPGLDYFASYKLDPELGAAAEAPFDLSFEVMEALNGVVLNEANRQSIEDWFHLLNRGYPIRIVGTSDAHTIDGGEPGYARTYVLYKGLKGNGLDVPALIKALKEGRSFVSAGPVVSVRANGRATFGDLVSAKKGRVDLDITVSGAPWMDVSEVRVVVNGVRREPIAAEAKPGAVVKFRDRVRLTLERDAWIAVEVIGRASLYPLVQQRSDDGKAENAALPYVLTNPIYVDADGDGRSDPVWRDKVIVK
jgi:hypothetical protein